MNCELCGRELSSAKELEVHKRYFHAQGRQNHQGDCCPECGGAVMMQEGCRSCPACGWSKCS